VRRLLPWALVGLIGVGAALGATLGQVNAPGMGSSLVAGTAAQRWLAGVLATTKAAGTAHLNSSQVIAGRKPVPRESTTGSGVIDFATESFRVSETDNRTALTSENGGPAQPRAETTTDEEIAIGPTLYESFGVSGGENLFVKLSLSRNLFSDLGLSVADGFGDALSTLSRPFNVVAVTDLGSARVDGTPATRYVVQTQAPPICPAARHSIPLRGTTTIWVDRRGRLVQARVSGFFNEITSTLRLSRFGAPVRIVPPSVHPGGGTLFAVGTSGSGRAVARCG
jgi:hypothetical protein